MRRKSTILLVGNEGKVDSRPEESAFRFSQQSQLLALKGRKVIARGNAPELNDTIQIDPIPVVVQSDAVPWGKIFNTEKNRSFQSQ